MSDLISRADAICEVLVNDGIENIVDRINALPSADAEVSDYAKWLEDIIVKAETLEWLCEDTPCKEWCDKNCHYSSIQVECLRHLYEVSKGGDDE